MQLEPRLRAFAALARTRSFTRAGDELALTQPAVSRHVAALEDEVGMLLVIRGRGGLALTPAGEYVAAAVLRAEALLAEAEHGLASFDGRPSSVSVAASGTPGTYLLPEVIASLVDTHPHLSVGLSVGTSAEAVESVRAHRAAIGVVGGFVAAVELEVTPIVNDRIVVVVSPALSMGRPDRRRLGGVAWITREEGSATRAHMEAAWRDLGIVPARVLELPTWEAVKRAVAAGAGVAAVSRLAIDLELVAGSLRILDLPRWRVVRPISIVRSADTPPTPAAQAFVDALRAHAGRAGLMALGSAP